MCGATQLMECIVMRVGDLDGRNSVYKLTVLQTKNGRVVDLSGSVVLDPHERLLFSKTEFRPIILRTGHRKDKFDRFFPTSDGSLIEFFPGDGWGTIYFTDCRIIFLRRPSYEQLMEVYGSSRYDTEPTIPRANLLRAARIMADEGLEFFEIRHEDITRFECGMRHANIRFRTVDENEYALRLPKETSDRIVPVLESRGVQGTKRKIAIGDIPIFWSLVASFPCAFFLMWLLGGEEIIRNLGLSLSILSVLAMMYLMSSIPSVKSVKKRRWGGARASRIKTILAFSIAGAIMIPGVVLTYFHDSILILVFTLAFCSVFIAAGIFLSKDWKYLSKFEGLLGYEYICPSCGRAITRRDISCTGCGSCVWWKCKAWDKRSRRKGVQWLSR